MKNQRIKILIKNMTVAEKASLCAGEDFWHTHSVERLGIPATMLSDGPHGLRKQEFASDHLGLNGSISAVCFPAGCGAAASFNKKLIQRMGETLGEECQAEGVSVILGPAINIKRSPLCGRNFEYYSEDPYVTGEIGASLVRGIQSKNVGTSPKHFLANNQEHRRMSSSSLVDERTLREMYLFAFEKIVKEEKPWTIMCSYNKINGIYAAQNKKYLTDILRAEWGFDGYVVSDWGAVNERIADLKAGMDLEMPGPGVCNTKEIMLAVEQGILDIEILNQACERILKIVYRFKENRNQKAVFDRKKDHDIAKEIAEETVVLLKNDKILPLKECSRVAFVGKYAKEPRYQGGGSSHINSSYISSALESIGENCDVSYARGFEDAQDLVIDALVKEAVELAKESEVAVIFAGLPDSFESEGYDRTHMRLPDSQNMLINAVCEVQENVVVVLHNGAPVEMPWISKVKGVLEAYLGGQAIGGVVADILYGKVNPSGKLPETFPIKLEDNPSYLFYGGEGDVTEYREGIFVGYRYYDKKEMDVLFPFGHGLSYTEFAYSDLKISKETIKDTDAVTVSVRVSNVGKIVGKNTIQLYVGAPKEGKIIRAKKELKGFEKVNLQTNESAIVTFQLDKRSFAYWNTQIQNWVVESGTYQILIGESSTNICLSKEIKVQSTDVLPKKYTMDTILGDLMEDKKAVAIIKPYIDPLIARKREEKKSGKSALTEEMGAAMIRYMPIRAFMTFAGLKKIDLEVLVEKLNQSTL